MGLLSERQTDEFLGSIEHYEHTTPRLDLSHALGLIRSGDIPSDAMMIATDPFGFEEKIKVVYVVMVQYCEHPHDFRDLLLLMLANGADPNASPSRRNPNQGRPALMCAVERADLPVVQELVRRGARASPLTVPIQRLHEASALHWMVRIGHFCSNFLPRVMLRLHSAKAAN